MAHYCKKLEKCGFIQSGNNANSSEKRIFLKRREKIKQQQALFRIDWTDILKTNASAKDEGVPNSWRLSRRKKD